MVDIFRRVNNLKKRWGTSDPFKICKYLKIQVRYINLGETKGFYKKVLKKNFIIINKELSYIDRKIICAHELGHCLLHSTKDTKNLLEYGNFHRDSSFEHEANEFTTLLLIDENFDDYDESCIKSELLEKLKFFSKY